MWSLISVIRRDTDRVVFSTCVKLNPITAYAGDRSMSLLHVCGAWSLGTQFPKRSGVYLIDRVERFVCTRLPRVCENEFVVYCTCEKETYFSHKKCENLTTKKGQKSVLLFCVKIEILRILRYILNLVKNIFAIIRQKIWNLSGSPRMWSLIHLWI